MTMLNKVRSLVLASALLATPTSLLGACAKESPAAVEKQYDATGKLVSFGDDRSFVNIAHDDIPGYMAAMTMSFEPKDVQLLNGLAVGDRVRFSFVETADARRLIQRIEKVK